MGAVLGPQHVRRRRPTFFGQLGHEDEAFSLFVKVTGPRAGRLREKLLAADEMVCNVELTGH